MGQKASKAIASRVSRSSRQQHPPPHPQPPQQQLPKVDPLTGFQRGSVIDPREEGQRQFLEKKGEYKELPPDLIQFLNDVGPLERSDEKEIEQKGDEIPAKKSARRRIPKFLVEENNNNHPTMTPPSDTPSQLLSDRQRQSMPLAEKVVGYDTDRTTSFSTRQDPEDPKDFGVGDVVDLFRFISRKTADAEPIDAKLVDSYHDEITRDRRHVEWTREEIQCNKDLLRNTLHYLNVPVLMKDTDNSYVGASPERVEELKLIKLVEVPKRSAILVLEDLMENEKVTCKA